MPRGSVGALYVLADACYNGYLTSGGLIKRERDEFYNTGDLVRWLGDGRISFVARQKGAHIKVRVAPRRPLRHRYETVTTP